MYYKYRNYISQVNLQRDIQRNTVTQDEITQLPAHFRDEINKPVVEPELPSIINPIFIYNAQYNIYMPPDERVRLNLLLKIDNPPENKDEEDLK